MPSASTRRYFLQSSAAMAASVALSRYARAEDAPANPNPKSDKPMNPYKDVRVAFVGVGGRGAGNLGEAVKEGCTPVALVDVDSKRLGEAAKKHPKARTFDDWRKMLDAMHGEIDGVLVATPDHNHAQVTMAAIRMGKHVYCEKPLTYEIWEARQIAEAARKYKVCTQMGNQHHSEDGLRSQVDAIKSGVIGAVSEVHVWTDRPAGWWPQPAKHSKELPAVPENLNYDMWIGPAAMRPYDPAYLPFKWRGWWDFGTGALGDMGCHLIDPPYWALDLDAPISVEAETEGGTKETGPKWSIIKYHFPARNGRGPVKLTWYDGGKLPPRDITDDEPLPDKKNGVIYVGEKGTLFAKTGGACERIGPRGKGVATTAPNPTLPHSPGHHAEWFRAIVTNNAEPALSNFDYSGPLTETVLLGNLAVKLGKKIVWDSEKLEVINAPEAKELIHRKRRKGWEL
ncbi:MAG TPA: Gfo/Idh/MocA family oxidoreductase [Tepidisphaeraceae bacterium]|nr:Gfo/Idh/MocA family oxidoreductase [Tepidisphaeraceae bacterium]